MSIDTLEALDELADEFAAAVTQRLDDLIFFEDVPPDPREDEDGVCWADQVGDRWEAAGADPGHIFESSRTLTPDCFPGVMVLAKDHLPPGKRPRWLTDVKSALVVLRRGLYNQMEEIELVTERGYRPVLVANWHRIQPTLG